MVNLEAGGIPAVFVASAEFVDAASAQSRALGSDPRAVFVAHPIQDRTDAELTTIAAAALDPIVEQLTGP